MERLNKRGISPIIATVLLISLAVIVSVIIFLWARNFVSERVEKFGQPIQYSCENINFEAEAISRPEGGITAAVVNRGNVPIYAFEIKQKNVNSFSINEAKPFNKTIDYGESAELDFRSDEIDKSDGEELQFVPLILGESSEGYKVAFKCEDKFLQVRIE